ncbi:cell division protein CrgA [Kocuria sp.]|uniref:cell division protein CrgA n=1 Tax=Kocuria sp. TaxID=1871328 RepID=UPI0026E0FB19|nr:cell division protein CrgA [Kocuria sp.]MDO5619729.1 cell division protein CrgA [Kocuria sp.]
MSESKKRLIGRKRTVVEDPAPAASVDDELTRLAVEALPERRRKEWERSQRANGKNAVGRVEDSESPDSREDTAEDVAEEISRGVRSTAPDADQTPTWYKIIMFGLIVIGLLWLIVWYLMDYSWPIPAIGYGNVGIGVGLMMIGLVMTTRWR